MTSHFDDNLSYFSMPHHRRNVSEEDNVVLTEQRTIGLGNMKVTTVPDSTPSTGGQEQLSQRQTRGNKNCVVM